MKVRELREMSDEQLGLTAKEAADDLFRLKVKAQTEQLKAHSQVRKNRKMIARVKTIMTERSSAAPQA